MSEVSDKKTLHQYSNLSLRTYGPYNPYETSSRPSFKHYRDARGLYRVNYRSPLPTSYQITPGLVGSAYEQLYRAYKTEMDRAPATSLPAQLIGNYHSAQDAISERGTKKLAENQVTDDAICSVYKPAIAIAYDIGQSVAGKDMFPKPQCLQQEGHISKADLMIWHPVDSRKIWLLATEFKGVTEEPTRVNTISTYLTNTSHPVLYEQTQKADKTKIAIGKVRLSKIKLLEKFEEHRPLDLTLIMFL